MLRIVVSTFLGGAAALVLAGCGTTSVTYKAPIASATALDAGSDSPSAKILAAAGKGAQSLTLPNSRLVVVSTFSAPASAAAQAAPPAAEPPAVAAPPPAGPPALAHKPAAAAAPAHPVAAQPAQIGEKPAAQVAAQSGGGAPAKSDTTGATAGALTFTSKDGRASYAVSIAQVASVVTFSVNPTNDFFSSNDFAVTRLANTRIPTTVSNTFTDETAARIKSVTSIAASVAAAVAGAKAPDHGSGGAGGTAKALTCAPQSFDVTDSDIKAGSDKLADAATWKARKTSWTLKGDCLTVTITADPLAPNLVPIAYFANNPSDWNRVWPVPACMTATISIELTNPADDDERRANHAQGAITLIDPDYVEPMPIPKKGKIAMHPICGADLSDSPVDRYQTDFDSISAILAAFPTQASK